MNKIYDVYKNEQDSNKKPKTKNTQKKIIIFALSALLFCLMITLSFLFYSIGNSNRGLTDDQIKISKKIAPTLDILASFENNYYKDIDWSKKSNIVTNAVLFGIDKYSNFSPYESSKFNDYTLIDNAKVGISVRRTRYGKFQISNLHTDRLNESKNIVYSKANTIVIGDDQKKIYRGDEIHSFVIDNKIKRINGLDMDEYRKIAKILPETFKIQIKRDGLKDLLVFDAKKTTENKSYSTVANISSDTRYFKLESFTDGAANEFIQNINHAKNESIKKYIIDLRGNPGGSSDILRRIATLFYSSNDLNEKFKYKYKNEEVIQKFEKTYDKSALTVNLPDAKIAILADKFSASASEALIGLFRSISKNFVGVVGDSTYGKGVGQTIISRVDGKLSVTAFKYFVNIKGKWETPEGNGFLPDVKIDIEKMEGEITNSINNDNVVKEAIEILEK